MIDFAVHAEIEECLAAARGIARWFATRVGLPGQFEEFHSAALEGLCEAAETYRMEMGVPLKRHARRRMFGAVRDHRRWLMSWPRAGCESRVVFADPRDLPVESREFDRIDLADEAEAFVKALPAALKPLARHLLIDGLSQAESARALGLSPGYVSRLRRQIDERASRFAA